MFKRWFVIGGLVASVGLGQEEIPVVELEEVVVTTTKSELKMSEVCSSVKIITSDDIEKTGRNTVLDLLEDLPGVMVTRYGYFGGLGSVFLRGCKPGHLLVLFDGIELNDPMKSDRAFDFAHLTIDNIERIEVISSPQSVLYGSDAIAGVINIISKRGVGKPKFNISLEAGSYGTFREIVSVSGGGLLNYSIFCSRIDSEGISKSAKPPTIEELESDGYLSTIFTARAGLRVLENTESIFFLRYRNSKTEIDDGAYDDDPNYISESENFASKIEFVTRLKDWWDETLMLTYNHIRRHYEDKSDEQDIFDDESYYLGTSFKAEWKHKFLLNERGFLIAGGEYEIEIGTYYYRSGAWISEFERKTVDKEAIYLSLHISPIERLFITSGLRFDNHELFGSKTTYKISAAYLIPPAGKKFRASFATGFKSPSLYQLYSAYGSTDLKPEESIGYEIGAEEWLFDGKIFFEINYFRNEFTDLIEWDPATFKFGNIGKAETKGVEFGLTFRPIEILKLKLGYTYLEAKDKTTGLYLLRRPMHRINFGAYCSPVEKLDISLRGNYVGNRADYTPYPTRGTSPAYLKIDFYGSYRLYKWIKLFMNIDNLLNESYQEVYGYLSPPRSFYGGLKLTF